MKSDEKKATSGRQPHLRCAKCGAQIEVVLPTKNPNESAGPSSGAREIKVTCPTCGHETLVLFKSKSPEGPGKRQRKK
jgi:DNA-directed RNA polymerase subunit RPC12/RpoP